MNLYTSNSNRIKLRKFILGFLILIIFFFVFDRILYKIIYNLEFSYYKGNEFEAGFSKYISDKEYDMLILGSSRTYEGIHPKYIKKYTNINSLKDAYQGRGPKSSLAFYRLYKKYKGPPKYVIYGVDYFIYTLQSNNQWLSRYSEKIKGLYYLSSLSLLLKNRFNNDILLNNVQKNFNNHLNIEQNPIEHLINMQEYSGISHVSGTIVIDKRKSRGIQIGFRSFPGEEGWEFYELLAELDIDKVKTFLVVIPSHYGTYSYNVGRLRLIRNLRYLERKYKNIVVFNHNRPAKFKLHIAEYFIDGGWGKTNSHLSDKGAEIFNKNLCKDINKVLNKTVNK